MTARAGASLALLALTLLGCKGRKQRPPSPPVALVTEGEVRTLEEDALSRAKAYAAMSCERPVLRGERSEGAADSDILAVLDAEGPLQACYAAITPIYPRLSEIFTARPMPLDAQATREPALATSTKACEALDEVMENAIAHSDACSPFLPGKRPAPDLMEYFYATWAAVLRAREAARSGDPAAGARLLTSSLRLSQDLWRGGAPLLVVVVASASTRIVVPELAQLLPLLPRRHLPAVVQELERLADGGPDPGEALRSMSVEFGLYQVLPAIRADFEPPGGMPEEGPAVPRSPREGIDDHQALLLSWIAQRAVGEQWAVSCEGTSPKTCAEGIAETNRAQRERAEPAALDRALEAPAANHPEDLRALAIGVLAAMYVDSYDEFLGRLFEQEAQAEALLLLARSLEGGASGGPCPAPQREGAMPLEVREAAPGAHTVSPAPWIPLTEPPLDAILLTIGCAPAPESSR